MKWTSWTLSRISRTYLEKIFNLSKAWIHSPDYPVLKITHPKIMMQLWTILRLVVLPTKKPRWLTIKVTLPMDQSTKIKLSSWERQRSPWFWWTIQVQVKKWRNAIKRKESTKPTTIKMWCLGKYYPQISHLPYQMKNLTIILSSRVNVYETPMNTKIRIE